MANRIKSFSFRSGVQVDNDNFVVNPNGLVGIGTTLPSEVLDVRGNTKVVGHLTATDASVSGIVTVGSITINGSTGTISATTFSGSAGNFGDQAVVAIATDGFIAGATGLTTTSNLGVNTTSTAFELQVGSDPTTATGFGVTEGNITASGNLKISGISTTATLVVTGLSTTKDFEVTGVSTVGVVTGATYFGDASDITSGKWTLGAVGSSHYQFTGPGGLNATADPVIYLARGQSYEFVNNMGAHPFEIRSSNGGSAFSTGVTNNAVSNGTLRFDVPYSAPNSLYYQCTSHAGMGGTIVVYPNLFTV